MVKFYLILTIPLLSSSSISELIPQHIKPQKDEETEVFNVLEQFLMPKKPLNIGYLGSEHETSSAETKIVTQAVKQALKKVNPVFTDECLSKISLGDTNMIPGIAVKVPLFYHFENYGKFYTEIDIYIKEYINKKEEVIDVLKQFTQPTKPLNINYLGSEHETSSAETKIVTQAVKQALKKVNPVFTDECLSKISLGDTNMIPGIAIKVPLFYHLKNYGGSYEEIDIYIKENLSPFKETAREIAKKIKLECHLKNYCYQKMMDNPVVVEDIRQGLVGQKVLSAVEAQYVQPEHQMLTSNHKYKLRVVKDGKNRIFSTYSFYCKPIF